MIQVPAVSIVSQEHTIKHTVALEVAAAGSAIDGVFLPVAFRKLLPETGFARTNRTFGLLVLLLATVAYVLLTDVCCRTVI